MSLTNVDQGYAILVSAIMATLSVIFTYYLTRRKEIEAFKNNNSSQSFLKNNPKLYKKVAKIGSILTDARQFQRGDEIFEAHKSEIDSIVTHYETVGIGIKHGVISESFMYSAEETLITSVFESSALYVEEHRKRGRKNMLKNFEIMYIRCRFPFLRYSLFPVEWLNGKPIYWLNYSLFQSIYYYVQKSTSLEDDFLKTNFSNTRKLINQISSILVFMSYIFYSSILYLVYKILI